MAMFPEYDAKIETIFPKLNRGKYKITSPSDIGYNCIAWAVEINSEWWWPDPFSQYFWPEEVQRVCTTEVFIEAYSLYGYQVCDSPKFEPRFEKIAIYTDSQGTPKHASRQIDEERWTSKLGSEYDLTHPLDGLDGNNYGIPTIFMKRAKSHHVE